MRRRVLTVAGVVQGVGFRPFVYRLAVRHALAGTVCNTPDGVQISLEGEDAQIQDFLADFERELPPLAQITQRRLDEALPRGDTAFRILPSTATATRTALVPPDVSVCTECLRELEDPTDRRFAYAFVNCTDCGPRYTIVADVPYDRAATTMVDFPLCAACHREYVDPTNRRFHAQAICCPHCGPVLRLLDHQGAPLAVADPLAAARDHLAAGRVVAIKGVGGFHLAVDALNATAVQTLRQRKNRGRKPFALMSRRLDEIQRYAEVSPAEAAVLTSAVRPIVILRQRAEHPLAAEVAPGNRDVGVMLPYTPLHHLLLGDRFLALVLTSGNLADEPIVIDDREASARLGHVADVFLTYNRRILHRADDSILKLDGATPRLWRRSRGFVPRPLHTGLRLPPILAVGGMMKNVIALSRGADVFLSQHLGDTDSRDGLAFLEDTVTHLQHFLGITPELVAHDLHPDYLSTRFALERPAVPKIAVQHHEAHIASCQCEHHILEREVIGLAMDGTGYGRDGAVWGGEVFIGTAGQYRRAAHLEYVPMPGGELAIRQPWRMAVSWLRQSVDEYRALPLALLQRHAASLEAIDTMAGRGLNSPLTSSCGRLFDAVAALLGLADTTSFEGEPAVSLEMAADGPGEPYGFDLVEGADGSLVMSPRQTVVEIVADLRRGVATARIAARFHATLAAGFTATAQRLRQETGIRTVVLGGGVFLNSRLVTDLRQRLTSHGFEVFQPQEVPPGDGGLSLGQVALASILAAGSPPPPRIQYPVSSLQSPVSSLQSPVSSLQSPVPSLQSPMTQ
jgi:hydrogenase maturation protein HypF